MLKLIFLISLFSASSVFSTKLSQSKFADEALIAHNIYRRIHNAKPLNLNPELCDIAFQRAQEIAKIGKLQVKLSTWKDEFLGETAGLVKGFKVYSGFSATQQWYSTIRKFDELGNKSKEGASFTQMVWKKTREVGFGIAKGENGVFYFVAEYWPRGNINSLYDENVKQLVENLSCEENSSNLNKSDREDLFLFKLDLINKDERLTKESTNKKNIEEKVAKDSKKENANSKQKVEETLSKKPAKGKNLNKIKENESETKNVLDDSIEKEKTSISIEEPRKKLPKEESKKSKDSEERVNKKKDDKQKVKEIEEFDSIKEKNLKEKVNKKENNEILSKEENQKTTQKIKEKKILPKLSEKKTKLEKEIVEDKEIKTDDRKEPKEIFLESKEDNFESHKKGRKLKSKEPIESDEHKKNDDENIEMSKETFKSKKIEKPVEVLEDNFEQKVDDLQLKKSEPSNFQKSNREKVLIKDVDSKHSKISSEKSEFDSLKESGLSKLLKPSEKRIKLE